MISLVQDYNLQWTGALIVLAAMFCYRMSGGVGRVAAGTLFYFLVSGVWTWVSSANRYASVHPYDQQAIRFFAADATCKLILVLSLLPLRARASLGRAGELGVLVFWLLDIAVMLYQAAWQFPLCRGENVCGSLVGNPSMNACLLVAMTPIVFQFLGLGCAVPMLFVLIFSKASIPYGMAAAGVMLWAWFVLGKKRATVMAGLAMALVMGLGWFVLGAEFTNTGDRLEMWQFFLGKWNVPIAQIWGTGFGTFGVFSRNLQAAFHMRENGWWIWAHNDWLQEMMEVGVVGVALLASTYLVAASKLFLTGRREMLVSFLLYGLMMTMNYPLHLAPTALFGAWLALCALQSDAPNPYCSRGELT